MGAKNGEKALAKITRWDDPMKAPSGEILQVLGRAGEHNVEMQAIVLDKGLRPDFPAGAEEEAEKVRVWAKETEAAEIARRRDMSKVLTFTIDPDDAKDFDDALSIQELPNGNIEIGIHIADVSHFLKKGSFLDKEAARRATSIYLVDRTIPMLPEILSNDLCSLNPHETKLTFSAVFTFTKDSFEPGKPVRIVDAWIGETVIFSDKRFTYEEAQKILDDKDGLHFKELLQLDTLGKKLRKDRIADGALMFDHDEIKFILDDKGVPVGVKRKMIQDTNRLIEEFMLLANKHVAEWVGKKDKNGGTKDPADRVFVYRIHDVPNQEKVADLVQFLRGLGYPITLKDGVLDSKTLNALLAQIEGKPEASMIQTAAVRSMAKAIYSTKNIGHYGLAFEHYTHFTSPIRRYPDTMVHRLVKEYLAGERVPANEISEYQTMSNYASDMERRAAEAERASIKFKQGEYMSARVGQVFDGVISGVAEWGIYVEEEATRSEGLVSVRALSGDFYELNKKTYSLIGTRTKKTYRLGDKIKVKVLRVNPETRLIDYGLAP